MKQIFHWKNSLITLLTRWQWGGVIIMTIVMIAGMNWGLPNRQRMQVLLGGKTLTDEQQRALTEQRVAYYARMESEDKVRAQTYLTTGQLPVEESENTACSLNDAEQLTAFRAFLVGSSAVDERKPYSALSRMNPTQLDFDPHLYIYGGTYLYPLGAGLFVLQQLGLLQISSDLSLYLRHPEYIAAIYLAGRSLSVGAFLGVLFLLGRLGNWLGGRLCGSGAMLAWSLSVVVLNQSIVSKPHVYAAFWGLLGVTLLVRFQRRHVRRDFFLSAIALGWAAGASFPAALLIVFFPALLFDRRNAAASLRRIVGGIGLVFGVAILMNPYIVLSYDVFRLSVAQHGSTEGYGYAALQLAKIWPYVRDMLTRGYAFPLSLLAIWGGFTALSGNHSVLKRLAIGTMAVFVTVAMTLASLRISLFLGPFLCLLMGVGFRQLWLWGAGTPKIVRQGILALLVGPPVGIAAVFAYDTIYDAGYVTPVQEWLETLPEDAHFMLGVWGKESLDPVALPPFPFLGQRIVDMTCESAAITAPQYVLIGNYTNEKSEWEASSMASRYRLQADFGCHRYNEWLLAWRVRNQSRTCGWLYGLTRKGS